MSRDETTDPPHIRRLELSLNPSDGSLSTAPLLSVIFAATDALYSDLYNMAHGELDVTTVTQDQDEPDGVPSVHATKRERMSNLSFAQRRHELAWRLARHGKALQHVAALTAAAASSQWSQAVTVSSKALQYARTAWIQADEAQDALYFFHAQLFPARAAPHDVYGALDVQLEGAWYDLPTDLRLTTDKYEMSKESTLSRNETDQRWRTAVRDKLLRGEVGWMRKQGVLDNALWKVSLRGGLVRLTQGHPKLTGPSQKPIYPIEALLTVLNPEFEPKWTLLSIETRVQAKTGEFNFQLETSLRQRYDLHRLAALAMTREEEREANQTDEETPPRPLHALFQVAHIFSLSWQLEMLSAQAQALRRGVWAAGASNPISVTPVSFYESHHETNQLGVVSISFWKVDDSYGPPSMADLGLDLNEIRPYRNHPYAPQQFTLSIRAEADAGIMVSLSGADSIISVKDTQPHTQATIRELLAAATDPFALSASDALLAATKLCAERKCFVVIDALQPANGTSHLPSWMKLSVDRGSISVSARVSYHGLKSDTNQGMPVLFRIKCDCRTGSFVCIFPKCANLLRKLACNDTSASETLSLRIGVLPENRRRAAGGNSTGRFVRDAFESLIRSMNLLGQRTGVGGAWEDLDSKSASLRERSIQSACFDVCAALMKCCAVATMYGLGPIAIGTAVGVDAAPDRCGGAVDPQDGVTFLAAPPVGVMLGQEIVESQKATTDGVIKKSSFLQQSFFALSCSVDTASVILYPLEISMTLFSPTSDAKRVSATVLKFPATLETVDNDEIEIPLQKRQKMCKDVVSKEGSEINMLSEADKLSAILNICISSCLQA